ncbi:NmrA/HSCARG family protein [Streptomonospora sediminis]
MSAHPAPVLVTGATGKQGGATARALVAAGVPVRALVRDPSTDRAAAVAALGAELVTGDLRDRDSLVRAAEGARAVFSVQTPDLDDLDGDSERVQGINLIEAARQAGVPQFVHTSTSGAGEHRAAPGWNEGRWAILENYYETKTALQDRLREAGFEYWTLLKPGFFMENFLPPSFLMPNGPQGGLITVIKPASALTPVAVEDVGTAAAAAIADPDRFNKAELDLAGDVLTMAECAAILGKALGVELTAPDMTTEEAVAAGMPYWASAHAWQNEVGQPARPEQAQKFGLTLTTLDQWAQQHLAPQG